LDTLNTTLGARSQTFIDMKDSIYKGIDSGELKTEQDINNFIIDTGYNPDDYSEANREYNRIINDGGNPREVGVLELVGKTITKGVSDAVVGASNMVPITKNLGKLVGDGTKDWWSNFSDPYTPPGAKELTKEIGADLVQATAGIVGVAKTLPFIGKYIPIKKNIKKVDIKKVAKDLKRASENAGKLTTILKQTTKASVKPILVGTTGVTIAFNPDEAPLDLIQEAYPETVDWAGLTPIVEALAVDPEDPKALQYANQFAQELFTAGVISTPIIALTTILKRARNLPKVIAKEEGLDAPIETLKNKGDDSLANQADQEKVLVNEIVEVDNIDDAPSLIKRIKMLKPIARFRENMTSTRNIGDDAYDLWITKQGTPKVIKQQTNLDLKDFSKAIKKDYGQSKFKKLKKNIQDKINNVLVLDKDNPAYISLLNKNVDIIKPIIKKQLDAENAKRITEGKKKIPIKSYNKKFKDLVKIESYKQTDNFYRIQRTKLLKTLGPNTQKIVTKLRANVDDHSNYLINSGVMDSKMSAVFGSNNDFYLQRSYNMFDDPVVSRNLNKAYNIILKAKKNKVEPTSWGFKTEINKIQKFHSYLKNTLGIPEDQINDIIKRNISKEGAEETFNFFNFTNKNFGNPNVLKHRKIFGPELRDMWGERKNPLARYSRTIQELGKISSQVKFLNDLKVDGLNKGYLHLSSKIKPSKKIKSTDDLNEIRYKLDATDKVHLGRLDREGGLQLPSAFKSPLEGVFADADWANGITRGLTQPVLPIKGTLGSTISVITGGLKSSAEIAKTVLSPVTQAVNFAGNMNFAILLGGVNPVEFINNLTRTVQVLGRGPKWNAWFNKRVKLGMIDESVKANQMQAYMDSITDVADPSLSSRGNKILKVILSPIRVPTKIYSGADSIMRATVFDSLRSSIKRGVEPSLKDMPILNDRSLEDVLDHFIAERVRQRMPTWSMVPRGIKGLKNIPLFGSFPSWFEEILRTTNKTIQGIGRDLSGRSVNDLARQAGFKSADDMLAKTGYNLRNKKVMGYLRGKGLYSLGAGTGLALGYDALQDQSRLSYNISEKQSDTLDSFVDYYATSAKYFTNSPERVEKIHPKTGVKTTHLIYSYRNFSRVDVWQGIKDPLRKIIKGIKSNEELTDNQIFEARVDAVFKAVAPIFGWSIAAQAIKNVLKGDIDLLPEGSGEKETAEFMERILGPTAGFTPGFYAEYLRLSRANITEQTLKDFGATENVWEWNGKSWVNMGGRPPEGINPKSGTPAASKYLAGKLWETILDGKFNKITKESIAANFGMGKKQVDINQLVKFKVGPMVYEKSLIKAGFYKDLIKMKAVGVNREKLLNYYRDTLEKHYQADKTLSKLVSKFRILGLSDSEIAVAVSSMPGKDLTFKKSQVQKLLMNKYDNRQLIPDKRMKRLLKEAGIERDSPIITEMNNIWNEYTNKPFILGE